MDNNNLYVRKNMHHTTVTLLVTSLVIVLVIFISIGYSAINASLMVTGDLEYEAGEELYSIIAKESKGLDTNIDFSVAPTADTSGVYKMSSTNNAKYPVYYYRGIIDNNNVTFAGFCWKIVRTTETGGVKLIYNGVVGSDGSCNPIGISNATIGTSKFNDSRSDAKYLGYTYDTNTDSVIKTYIDNWYLNNMTKYTVKLEDTEFCNDRSISNIKSDKYGGYDRNMVDYKPSIVCPNEGDKYTVSSSKGNGLLKYPIGLLTADEMTLAGGRKGWLQYKYDSGTITINLSEWTLTPYGYKNFEGYNLIRIDDNNLINYGSPFYTYYVRPVISLLLGSMVSNGDGTIANPYQVLTD